MAKHGTVSLYEAKTRLSRLVDRALRGDEVVITRHGRPVARLVPAKPERAPRKLGALRGKIRISSRSRTLTESSYPETRIVFRIVIAASRSGTM